MKKVLVGLLALFAVACVVPQGAESRPSTGLVAAQIAINNAAFFATYKAKKDLAPETVKMLKESLPMVISLAEANSTDGSLQKAMDALLKGKQLDPDPVISARLNKSIQDAIALIEAEVGPIQFDVDGKLNPAQKGLILALLTGLRDGLQ